MLSCTQSRTSHPPGLIPCSSDITSSPFALLQGNSAACSALHRLTCPQANQLLCNRLPFPVILWNRRCGAGVAPALPLLVQHATVLTRVARVSLPFARGFRLCEEPDCAELSTRNFPPPFISIFFFLLKPILTFSTVVSYHPTAQPNSKPSCLVQAEKGKSKSQV